MKRSIWALLLTAAVLALGVPVASAKELKVIPLKWQNRVAPRIAFKAGTCAGCAADTTYLSISTANVCTTMVADVRGLVVPTEGTATLAAADTLAIAWVYLVTDSAAVGDLTNIQINVLHVVQRDTPTGAADIPQATTQFGTLDEIITAGRVMKIPISGIHRNLALGAGSWQISATSLAGTSGRLRPYLAFYVN